MMIRCKDESDHLAILGELDRHGLDTKAICAGLPKEEKKELAPAPPILRWTTLRSA
jgi:hypothetical protein